MYTIIGGDGKEYGPVPAAQIQAWILSGRANLATRVKVFGTDEWKTLGDIPAFASGGAEPPPAIGGTPENPAAQPAGPGAGLEVISCYERSWSLLKANFWPFIGITLLLIVLAYGASAALQAAVGRPDVVPGEPLASVMAAMSKSLSVSFIEGFLFTYPLVAGFYFYFLKKARGENASAGDVFAGFRRAYLPLVLAGILVTVLTTVGFICFILPGVYLVVAYSLTPVIIVDRRIGVWEAMELSRRTITSRWWLMLGLFCIGIVLMLAGLVALIVGFLVAIPVFYGALIYAYIDLFPAPRPSE